MRNKLLFDGWNLVTAWWERFRWATAWEPRYRDDPAYAAEVARVDNFPRVGELNPQAEDLLLEFAEAKFAEKLADLRGLQDKLDGFLQFAVGLFLFLGAGAKALDLKWTIFMVGSFILLTLAVGLLVWARRAGITPARPSIQLLREGLLDVERPKEWLACALHKAAEGIKVRQEILGIQLNASVVLIVFALVLLLPTIIANLLT